MLVLFLVVARIANPRYRGLQTILDPCHICQGQMDKFQKLYNAKIKIYSSGAPSGKELKDLYPKYKVENPYKK